MTLTYVNIMLTYVVMYRPFAEETPVVAHIVPAIDTIRRVTKCMEENGKFRRGQLGFAQAKGLNHLYLQAVQSISVLRLSRRRNLDDAAARVNEREYGLHSGSVVGINIV